MGGPKDGRLGRGNLRIKKERVKEKVYLKNYLKKTKI